MSIPNFITVEDIVPHIPTEHKDILKDTKWEDVTFTTFSICESMMLDYEITDDGRLYKKEEDGGIQLVDDYTGKIEFGTVVMTEKKDVEITLEALFFKGDLKHFNFIGLKELDRDNRVEAQERLMKIINKQEGRSKKWWYKIYVAYTKLVIFIFTCIRWVLGLFIKLCWMIQNKIT